MHNAIMRTHRDILRNAGHSQVAALTKRPITTVRSWDQRDSIPPDMWLDLSQDGHATLEELALAANARVRPQQSVA